MAISADGKRAYIPFELDDALLVVDLTTFTVTDSIDVSTAGNMLGSTAAVLTPDGKKLYVSNYLTKNVIVVNTENKRVEKVLPLNPLHAVAITMSPDKSKAYIPSEDGGLYIVNTSDDSYQRVFVPGVIFGTVAPSPGNPDVLYTVGTLIAPGGIFQMSFFAFNVTNNTVVRSSNLVDNVLQPRVGVRRLVINLNETLGYFGGYEVSGADKGVGNFTVFDLTSFRVVTSVPIENGVADFAVSEKTGKIYIIGLWAGGGSSNRVPILEWDIPTGMVVRNMPLSPSSDQRAIAIDPADADYLYETDGDHNLIRKVEISTGKEVRSVRFNKADIRPYAIIRGDDTGYIFCNSGKKIYKLDLMSGQLIGNIEVPVPFHGWGFYQGRLYVASGSDILAISPSDGSIIKRYPIGRKIQPLIFTFFGDRMATIDFETGGMIAGRLLVFDASTMSILKTIELPHQPYGDKVIASPDGSKLYVSGGPCVGGTTFITVFNASTLEVSNTIEIPPVQQRRGATGFLEGDFDEANRILYLTGFESVYKIDMNTDKLLGTLDLIDLYGPQSTRGWTPTGLCGIVLSGSKDRLFVVSGDAHVMYKYDLTKSSWSTKVSNLHGYFITDALCSPFLDPRAMPDSFLPRAISSIL